MIEADVNASFMSITAIWAIEKVPLKIYKLYFTKNNPHKANALRQPRATKVYISVDLN